MSARRRAAGTGAAKHPAAPRRSMRALLIAALFVAPALLLVTPTASACCHVLYYREDVGPCHVEWAGDGLRLQTDYVEAGCLGHDTRVEPKPLP